MHCLTFSLYWWQYQSHSQRKVRPASWGSQISWEKADPFGVSRQFVFSIQLFYRPPSEGMSERGRCFDTCLKSFCLSTGGGGSTNRGGGGQVLMPGGRVWVRSYLAGGGEYSCFFVYLKRGGGVGQVQPGGGQVQPGGGVGQVQHGGGGVGQWSSRGIILRAWVSVQPGYGEVGQVQNRGGPSGQWVRCLVRGGGVSQDSTT